MINFFAGHDPIDLKGPSTKIFLFLDNNLNVHSYSMYFYIIVLEPFVSLNKVRVVNFQVFDLNDLVKRNHN